MRDVPVSLSSTVAGHDERLALSVEEFAECVGISRTSAYLACQRGEVPSVQIGRRRLVPRRALEAFLAGQPARGSHQKKAS